MRKESQPAIGKREHYSKKYRYLSLSFHDTNVKKTARWKNQRAANKMKWRLFRYVKLNVGYFFTINNTGNVQAIAQVAKVSSNHLAAAV